MLSNTLLLQVLVGPLIGIIAVVAVSLITRSYTPPVPAASDKQPEPYPWIRRLRAWAISVPIHGALLITLLGQALLGAFGIRPEKVVFMASGYLVIASAVVTYGLVFSLRCARCKHLLIVDNRPPQGPASSEIPTPAKKEAYFRKVLARQPVFCTHCNQSYRT